MKKGGGFFLNSLERWHSRCWHYIGMSDSMGYADARFARIKALGWRRYSAGQMSDGAGWRFRHPSTQDYKNIQHPSKHFSNWRFA